MTYITDYGDAVLWNDYLSSISAGRVPPANFPAWSAIGPSGTNYAYSFAVNDYIFLEGFHILHDIKRGSLMYPHVHWTSDGTDTNIVKWELSYTFAKGHNQAAFPENTVINIEQAGSGTAWQHMVAEVGESTGAFTAPEVDSLVLMRLRRVTNAGTENTDGIFGLFVDMHVQIERPGTINKAPNFYA